MAKTQKQGEYVTLSGVIDNRKPIGVGGEVPPAGSYLILDRHVHAGHFSVWEVYLLGRRFAEGEHKKLFGRLDAVPYGGVETPQRSYVRLSGISDLDAGEPYFDGAVFHSAVDGAVLQMLGWSERPRRIGAPNTIAVLDGAPRRAFMGTMSGGLPPTISPFHGFDSSSPIETPTEADRAAVRITEQALPISTATGKPLTEVGGQSPPPGTADMFAYSWYLDRATETIYGFVSGGFAGFIMRLNTVIHMGGGAPAERSVEPAHP
jgi:hypothetical protein